jgi:hypothetical protein
MSSDHEHESPTEALLREALAARAALITEHDLRPADPPSQHRRRLGPVRTTVITLLALAAAVTIGLFSVKPHTVAASPASTSYNFRGIGLTLPPGWTVGPGRGSGDVCLLAPHRSDPLGLCSPYGVRLITLRSPAEQQTVVWPTKDDLTSTDGAWSPDLECPIWDGPNGLATHPMVPRPIGTPVRRTGTVGGKAETDTTWRASCNATQSYTARMWGLDDYRVYVVAAGLKEEYQPDLQTILGSMDFTAFNAQPSRPAVPGDAKVTISQVRPGPSDEQHIRMMEFTVTMTDVTGGGYGPVGLQADARVTGDGVAVQYDWYNGRTWQRVDSGIQSWQAYDLLPGQSITVKYRAEVMSGDGGVDVDADVQPKAQLVQPSGGGDPTAYTLVAKAEGSITRLPAKR